MRSCIWTTALGRKPTFRLRHYPHATCMAMDATTGRHADIFTYKVGIGQSGNSYGLKIAALAGMPESVLSRATELMGDPSG
jgi:DNA mismatch repair ATPase MutS